MIGVGVVLLLAGIVLTQEIVTVDANWLDEYKAGVLLTIVGVVMIALNVFLAIWRNIERGRR